MEGEIPQTSSISSRVSKLTPHLFKDTEEKKAVLVRWKKKQQNLRRRLGRDPRDTRGRDSDNCFDFFQCEKGREDLPGVSHRTSLHILTITDDEIREDTLKSRAFIDRYYQAFDDRDNMYSIWTLPEMFKDQERYRPQDITVESLETINRHFNKHAKQILDQLACDAAERHTREAKRRKNIAFIGMFLSAFTALSGSVTGFMNDGSPERADRLAELGYSQIVIGIVFGIVLKFISSQIEEHAKAARNLDCMLTWVDQEIKRLKTELIRSQEPYLERLGCNQLREERALSPIESRLLEMKFLWLKPNRLAPDKSLFESIARLQQALFGAKETSESVEQALLDFRGREKKQHGLFQQHTDLGGLAKIYGCAIVLISETLLSNDAYYQLINEPILQVMNEPASQHVTEQSIGPTTYTVGDEKENEVQNDERRHDSFSVDIDIEAGRPPRFMVLYMPRDNVYEPVLAPLDSTWDEVKAKLLCLASPTVTSSELERALPSI